MNYKIVSLSLLALLAACDGSEERTSESSFAPPVEIAVTPPAKVPEVPPAQAIIPAKPELTPEEIAAAAYDAVAPKDTVVEEKVHYDTTQYGSVELSLVNEQASAKRHTMMLDGKTIHYTARAGHLVAYDATKKNAEAAIFYTAYTRDDLPKDKRPVTFFWNGGPGSSSIWLHMGSWAPKRLKTDAPNIPESAYAKQPESFPFLENDITLLGQSDLVFVDPPGTGHSTAIEPFTNKDFWGTDVDAKVIADFITRYNNVNGRQSSPKYLYGESYGGIRTPIVASLLEEAGKTHFEPDKSGKPPIVLSGFILNSPLVDYTSNCNMRKYHSGEDKSKIWNCAGFIPSYAMTVGYFNQGIRKETESKADYLGATKEFVRDNYTPIFNKYVVDGEKTAEWTPFFKSPDSDTLYYGLKRRITEKGAPWDESVENFWYNFEGVLDLVPVAFQKRYYNFNTKKGFFTGRFDARMMVPYDGGKYAYGPDSYIDVGFLNQFKSYLPNFANYHATSDYQPNNGVIVPNWVWKRASQTSNKPISIPDIQNALTYDPALKLLILHGYQDIATPGYQTELDLEGAKLLERIPVKWFEGGHMTYNTESSRPLLKKTLDQYYEGAPYDAETALTAQMMQQMKQQSKIPSASQLVPAATAN